MASVALQRMGFGNCAVWYSVLLFLIKLGCTSAQSFRGAHFSNSSQELGIQADSLANQPRKLQMSYLIQLSNRVGSNIYFKIGGGSMPLLCQSNGIVVNPAWEQAQGATQYTIAQSGAAIVPQCAPTCTALPIGDISESDSICDLPDNPCSCLYVNPGCKTEDLCAYANVVCR